MSDNTEVRDRLAAMMGFVKFSASDTIAYEHWLDSDGCPVMDGDDGLPAHPIENSLDSAAACLPKDWTWARWGDGVWIAQKHGVGNRPMVEVVDTGDELADRFALAEAVHRAEGEKK